MSAADRLGVATILRGVAFALGFVFVFGFAIGWRGWLAPALLAVGYLACHYVAASLESTD